jgi:molybdopterin/thiamine biosynthesis adenylyltransferase
MNIQGPETRAKELLETLVAEKDEQNIEGDPNIIDLQGTSEISRKSGLSLRKVEILALQSDLVPKRYLRNLNTLSKADQIALLQAEVVLMGVGGLGGYLLEMLCRLGVGRIVIVDGDIFEESNLNRQLLGTEKSVGLEKVRAAKDKMSYVNSAVEVQAIERFLDEKELIGLLQDKDLVLDALGGLAVRKVLLFAAQSAGLPLISGFVAGATGCVSTVFPGDKGLLSIWEGQQGAEEALGCLAYTVSAIASMQCAEAVNLLCGQKRARLQQKMAVCDLQECTWEIFEIPG